MGLLVVLPALALFALCAGNAIPPIPRDISNLIDGENEILWMNDDDGVPHLIDHRVPVDHKFLASRNGANNQYWLYTRNNRNNKQDLYTNNIDSVRNSNYNANHATIVIAHGWQNNGNSGLNGNIRDAVLDVWDANVIVVDWGSVASNVNYYTAAAGVPSVGQYLGDFLSWLINNAGGNWNNVHLVGHSLGAHVVGNAGRRTGSRPSRVTGMDAARPSWENNGQALNRNDGQYVEAIHTDGNLLGLFPPIADADFYPNGGTNPQPGCGAVDSPCSHGRAHEFFASSVRTNHFVGIGCPNEWEANLGTCNGGRFNMGNNILTKRGNGIYYLRTGSSWPF